MLSPLGPLPSANATEQDPGAPGHRSLSAPSVCLSGANRSPSASVTSPELRRAGSRRCSSRQRGDAQPGEQQPRNKRAALGQGPGSPSRSRNTRNSISEGFCRTETATTGRCYLLNEAFLIPEKVTTKAVPGRSTPTLQHSSVRLSRSRSSSAALFSTPDLQDLVLVSPERGHCLQGIDLPRAPWPGQAIKALFPSSPQTVSLRLSLITTTCLYAPKTQWAPYPAPTLPGAISVPLQIHPRLSHDQKDTLKIKCPLQGCLCP